MNGRYRAALRTWLPPILYDVLSAPPSPGLLSWLWGDPVDMATLPNAEQWLLVLLALAGAPGRHRDAPALRVAIRTAPAWWATLPPAATAAAAAALDALTRHGWLPPDLISDDALATLLAWLDMHPSPCA